MLRNRFDAIANRMQVTLQRCGYSTVIKEGADCSVALFNRRGETIAQGVAIPLHLGSLSPTINAVLQEYPLSGLSPGDVLITNDPYLGAQHLPDVIVMAPIFVGDTPVAISAALAHQQDMGGESPGSTPTDAVELFQEGLGFPPVKIPKGASRPLRLRSSFAPMSAFRIVMGDIAAEISAVRVAAEDVAALCRVYGQDLVQDAMDLLLESAERQTRKLLADIPDGFYAFEDWLDNDGIDIDRPIRIAVRVHISGSTRIRFHRLLRSGAGPGERGASRDFVGGSLCGACDHRPGHSQQRRLLSDDQPHPAPRKHPEPAFSGPGKFAIHHHAPHQRRCLRRACPGFARPHSCRLEWPPVVGHVWGPNPHTGCPFIATEIGTGGMGGRPRQDGVDVIATDSSNAMNVPVEMIELNAPLRVSHYRIRRQLGRCRRFSEAAAASKRNTWRLPTIFASPTAASGISIDPGAFKEAARACRAAR